MLTCSKQLQLSLSLLKTNTSAWNCRYLHHPQSSAPSPSAAQPSGSNESSPGQTRRDLILSVLESHPSARDSRTYLKAFASSLHHQNAATGSSSGFVPASDSFMPTTAYPGPQQQSPQQPQPSQLPTQSQTQQHEPPQEQLLASMLTPDHSHTALVKVQGPFSDRQLKSISEGLVFLGRLGLFSIIVVDNQDWYSSRKGIPRLRQHIQNEALRLSAMLDHLGCTSRPIINGMFGKSKTSTTVDNLAMLKSAIEQGETPVIAPIAVDDSVQACPVSANDAIEALARALCGSSQSSHSHSHSPSSSLSSSANVSLVPVRIMIINREGGIPSHARQGDPHLSINLEAEYSDIQQTFIWSKTHPTALSNLTCLRNCLSIMPRSSSAVIVSHRSNRSLIANLITNKPAHSPSLNHSFLFTTTTNLKHTPTVVRHGLPIRVIRSLAHLDQDRMTRLLELAFNKKLNSKAYYDRLSKSLEFAIIAGDYQAAAIVTNERDEDEDVDVDEDKGTGTGKETKDKPIAYLDKFAVLPSLQGDGTVDFLWGALRDESFGLGSLDALNSNVGGRGGSGIGRDLVWRSRADNPVNKWYFERSNGFAKISMGTGGAPGLMFWCDAEVALKNFDDDDNFCGIDIGFAPSSSKQTQWSKVISRIPSCWVK